MNSDIRVAAAVMKSIPGRPDINLSRMREMVRSAAEDGVEILCFPEACITGYGIDPGVGDFAEPVPGPSCDAVLDTARQSGVTVLAGLIEKGEHGALYLTQFVASPDGISGIYRKTHLGPPEKGLFEAGNDVPVFRDRGAAFGIGLCYDGHFPEFAARLAVKGADILFYPHASPRGGPEQKAQRWSRYLSARAVDNGVFVVACNQAGDHPGGLSFPGTALIFDPRGRCIEKHVDGSEKIVTAVLSAEELNELRKHLMAYFLPHRRPELYGKGE